MGEGILRNDFLSKKIALQHAVARIFQSTKRSSNRVAFAGTKKEVPPNFVLHTGKKLFRSRPFLLHFPLYTKKRAIMHSILILKVKI